MCRLKKFGLNFHPDAIRKANPTGEQLAEREKSLEDVKRD
jgi:hypothetical protein